MSLMQQIRDYRVPKRAVAVWWLGQNGFIFKTPEGTTVSTDLYLTHSCEGLIPNFDLKRQVPIYIEPEDLELDIFTCTHNHQDHTDPETIRRLAHKDTMAFVGPPPSCGIYRAEGVTDDRIHMAWPDVELNFRDVEIHGTFALPTDATDLNHMGFVFAFGSGPRIYVTGDTDHTELLVSAAKHKPDVMITCINGGFNNMSHFEAADIAGKIQPRLAIPCHYDMFADNSVDPGQFRASLTLRAPNVNYCRLAHAEPFVIEA
ncbi:MAG: MBL fold metallo-hydrolase [Acidobacteriota bacterium]